MMTTMKRVAVLMGLVAVTAVPVQAAQSHGATDEAETEIFVINNHLVAVRVFAEDANGRLYRLGRVSRGNLESFEIPDEVSGENFRIKVIPANPLWAPGQDDYGVKTNPLDIQRDRQVRVWLEADLASSVVEIERG